MSQKEQKDEDRFETRAVHEGEDPAENQGAIIPPIFMSSTYELPEIGKDRGYDYSRSGNPTRTMFEKKIATLEGGRYGLAFASGMAAINAVLVLLKSKDGVLAEENVYGGTHRLLTHLYPKYDIDITWVDATDLKKVEAGLEGNTKLLWVETPTNPLLKIIDIEACARLAHEHDALLVVDNTFSSPYLQRPLELGADIVVHSTTKYIGGHSDFVGGMVVTDNDDLDRRMAYFQNAAGAVPSPFDCWLAARSVKTLALRMRAHCMNARVVAEHLSRDPRVKRIFYPGLDSHTGHELAKRQMEDFGGIISFELNADLEETKRFISELRLFKLAVSLGAVESLVAHPATMTHDSMSEEERQKAGISRNLVRISVGIEHVSDLVEDIENAMMHALGNREHNGEM